jgi:hypothetical protein
MAVLCFALAGKIPAERDPFAAKSIEGSWSGVLFPSPSPLLRGPIRAYRFPAFHHVIDI